MKTLLIKIKDDFINPFKAIKNWQQNKEENTLLLSYSLMTLITLISAIYSWIHNFISKNFNRFSFAIISKYFNPIFLIAFLLLFLVAFVLNYYLFVKKYKNFKFLIYFFLATIFLVLALYLILTIIGILPYFQFLYAAVVFNQVQYAKLILILYMILGFFFFYKTLQILYRNYEDHYFQSFLLNIVFAFLFIPILLFLSTNILAILVVIGLLTVVYFLSKNLLKKEKKENVFSKIENKSIIKEYGADTKFRRVENSDGYKYIEYSNSYGSGEVCSEKEFREKTVVIKCDGKEVSTIL